ncbi:MAG: hypothetical protein AVDCRST_MAG11-242 [uncultured Gemmatimonadaceae bacterium]|uniref:Uncharacterized protein n=1 Tax=uncultured Gemmatimonadaceae bacterium TaxID=246130 RepID=A0A6J4K1P8_9BACT|nr:MAG: hypothetical protein AVDCRST_MAG11-242 [uncultured Gemmatimonadaceae bacterium]
MRGAGDRRRRAGAGRRAARGRRGVTARRGRGARRRRRGVAAGVLLAARARAEHDRRRGERQSVNTHCTGLQSLTKSWLVGSDHPLADSLVNLFTKKSGATGTKGFLQPGSSTPRGLGGRGSRARGQLPFRPPPATFGAMSPRVAHQQHRHHHGPTGRGAARVHG